MRLLACWGEKVAIRLRKRDGEPRLWHLFVTLGQQIAQQDTDRRSSFPSDPGIGRLT